MIAANSQTYVTEDRTDCNIINLMGYQKLTLTGSIKGKDLIYYVLYRHINQDFPRTILAVFQKLLKLAIIMLIYKHGADMQWWHQSPGIFHHMLLKTPHRHSGTAALPLLS